MLTLEGLCVVHALQPRQLLKAASNSLDRNGSPVSMLRNSRAARIALARPRVDMISSPVATNVGHIVGASLRQPPQPLHCSRLPMNEPSLAANASVGLNGSFNSYSPPSRRSASILKRPSGMTLP